MKMPTVPLGEVCAFVRGVTFDKADVSQYPAAGHVALLRAGNISEELDAQNDLLWLPANFVNDNQRLRKNDIAICMSSGSSEVVGKTARVTANLNASVGSFCGIIRPKRAEEAAYISFFFRSSLFKKHRDVIARGANIQNLRFSQFDEIEVPLPSQQRQIAATLEQTDRLRHTRRYTLELGDEFLPATFRDWFANDHVWPAYPLEELTARKPNAIRTGPFGSQLLHAEFAPSGVAVLGIDNAVNNRFEWQERRFISLAKYEELKRYTVYPGDVIITIMGTCGRCAIVPDEIPTAINTKHLCCITLDWQKCLPIYLQMAFLHHPLVQHSLGTAQKGAIMDGLNMEIIKSLRIPLPPLALQQRFAALVARHERLRARHREALCQADHLFQTLLHRAFAAA